MKPFSMYMDFVMVPCSFKGAFYRCLLPSEDIYRYHYLGSWKVNFVISCLTCRNALQSLLFTGSLFLPSLQINILFLHAMNGDHFAAMVPIYAPSSRAQWSNQWHGRKKIVKTGGWEGKAQRLVQWLVQC
jgi:hypothetical protein